MGAPVANQGEHQLHTLLLRGAEIEAPAQLMEHLDAALEAGHIGALHHFRQQEYPVRVLARSKKALDAEDLKVVEGVAGGALRIRVHHLQQLARELEGRRLEVDPTGRVGQHEVKVDVHNVTLLVQQQVAVVPVLPLKQVAHHRVASHALYKVALRGAEGGRVVA